MTTIKQLIAEIQLAPDLPPNHKIKAVQIVRDAEERFKIKNLGKGPRKITNSKELITLLEWEKRKDKRLSIIDVAAWIDYRALSEPIVLQMIEEFRTEMISKAKQYNNFAAAFAVYLRKGYLSKKYDECLIKNIRQDGETTIHNRGVNL